MHNKSPYYWLFLTPALLALTGVLLIPLVMGAYYSLTDWDGQVVRNFMGLSHYLRLVGDRAFTRALAFTGQFTVVAVGLINGVGLGLALLVTRHSMFNTPLRTVFFMPNLMGGIILGFIWQFIFLRAFEAIAEMTGLAFFSAWLSTPATAFWGLIILYVWQMSGYIMIIYISFLNNIPEEILEAGTLDGASGSQLFWRVKFPMLAPAFTISLFLTLSGALRMYDQNMALTGGGPFNATQMVAMNIFNTAFRANQMAYAQAQAMVFLLISVLIALVQLYLTRRREVSL